MKMEHSNSNNSLTPDDQEANAPDPQRTFIIGDEWLFYKFYTGPKTADIVLSRMIKPLAQQLLDGGDIDKWFFIRYSDPQLHTRVRFHIKNPQALLKAVQAVNSLIKPFIQQDLIWKVQVDSYQREIERYGARSMELAETLFFYDSQMVVDMLDLIEGDEGERIRWLFGLRAVDALLEDFRYPMEGKYELATRLRESFGKEFGLNRALKDRLEKKFREDRTVITDILDHTGDHESEMFPLFQLLDRRSGAFKPIAEEILNLYDNKTPNPFLLDDLMGSYSHMMVNRLFKSRQRLHELVLYDFLHRYYKSEIARRKYADVNAAKQEAKENLLI
ncbi:MAG: thiopeptide-type bacteriocin biosynthesis protein [Candidatus Aminicenantes bacterium]|nr:thiopeptide-type bacteriocin biosynthesis protein [Candidatus Aminicenantes bacterium]